MRGMHWVSGVHAAERVLPSAPSARHGQYRRRRTFLQDLVIGFQEHAVLATVHCQVFCVELHMMLDGRHIVLPLTSKNATGAPGFVKPIEFMVLRGKDTSQHHARHMLCVVLGVRQGQRTAPRAATQQPLVHVHVQAQLLNIGHQIGQKIMGCFSVWRRATATALVHQNDAVTVRVKQAPGRG